MEHYRLRKYRGPEVWKRVRTAYEQGQTGPEVARRYDVGLANLRKKAAREGWSRSHQAAAADRAALATPAPPDPAHDAAARPADALASAVARASSALAGGRAAEAAGLLRAAESLARLTGAAPGEEPADAVDAPLTPEEDAAREAAAKKGWNDLLDLIEAQADALARQLLVDVTFAPAVHSGFVHAWRAQYLGPDAAAHDHARMQGNAAHRVAFHWHDDGRPLPVDEVRAMYYQVFRRQIRAKAGLPAVGPGDGMKDWG